MIIAQNVANMISRKPLVIYNPPRDYLSLIMTGKETAIGNKFGIQFSGKWVWNMKDYIDRLLMSQFDPNLLFIDYKK